MTEEESLAALAEIAVEGWEHQVERDGERAAWAPKLVLSDDSGRLDIYVVVPEGPGADVAECVMLTASEYVGPSTAWLGSTVDAYFSSDEAANRLVEAGAARLSELCAAGWPGVSDAIFVHMVNRAGRSRLRAMPYRIEGRRVAWLEPVDYDDDAEGNQVGGRLGWALRAAMTRAAN